MSESFLADSRYSLPGAHAPSARPWLDSVFAYAYHTAHGDVKHCAIALDGFASEIDRCMLSGSHPSHVFRLVLTEHWRVLTYC